MSAEKTEQEERTHRAFCWDCDYESEVLPARIAAQKKAHHAVAEGHDADYKEAGA